MPKSRRSSVLDRRLFPRTQQCITQFETEGLAAVTVAQIVTAVRNQFPEYARMQVAPLTQTIEKGILA